MYVGDNVCLQHFTAIDGVAESDVIRYGGAVLLADYCPYVQAGVSGCFLLILYILNVAVGCSGNSLVSINAVALH